MKNFLTIFLLLFFLAASGQDNFSISVKDTLKYQCPMINLNKIVVDIGSVNFGQRNTDYNFFLTNNSDTALIITNAYWAEPILGPTFKQTPIFKGQTGSFKYTLRETRRVGPFSKRGTVQTNFRSFEIVFKGKNLPPNIYIDKPVKIDTITLGDKIISEFKIYNRSDSSSLTIENIHTDTTTTITYQQNVITPNSYWTFKAVSKPNSVGTYSSKIIITINGTEVEHDIFATVQRKKRNEQTDKHKLKKNNR